MNRDSFIIVGRVIDPPNVTSPLEGGELARKGRFVAAAHLCNYIGEQHREVSGRLTVVKELMHSVIILILAWLVIWGITTLLPPITPGWLPFLPVLYPTYALIIRRRKPGVQRSIAGALTILLVWILSNWAISYAPKASNDMASVLDIGRWRFDVYVYEGEGLARYTDIKAQPSRRFDWRFPVWLVFGAVATYPASLLWREARYKRDHVRDTCLISFASGILFVGIFVQLMRWLPGPHSVSRADDIFLYVLAFPPAFSYLGTIIGFVWFVYAVQSLRRRPVMRAAKPILLTMSIAAVICSFGGVFFGNVELLPILVGLGVGSVVFFATCRYLHHRLPILYPTGHCHRCGYNLTGNVSGVCPECGTKIENVKTSRSQKAETT
jgi:predicted RNA-binding Zn-ribbon protein involved in translation (DUF1610 family)